MGIHISISAKMTVSRIMGTRQTGCESRLRKMGLNICSGLPHYCQAKEICTSVILPYLLTDSFGKVGQNATRSLLESHHSTIWDNIPTKQQLAHSQWFGKWRPAVLNMKTCLKDKSLRATPSQGEIKARK